MLNANLTRNFCVKDFQDFRQGNFAKMKCVAFEGVVCVNAFADRRTMSPHHVLRHGILKNVHHPRPKFLWLIPFMLAKKLLISTPRLRRIIFRGHCAARKHARRVRCVCTKKIGVKTRCFETQRADITRKIIRGLKNFPLRKKDYCR